MISHYYKCIFIHIPKTAGTSIRDFLGNKELIDPEDHFSNFLQLGDKKFNPPPPHPRAVDFLDYELVTKDIFYSYFKFAFVRNPWDRIVSEYKYRRHSNKYSFKTFLFHHFPEPSWSDDYCHVLPQYDFLYDKEGNLLVDFVGRYENIKHDFKKVCEKVGISNTDLPIKNKSLSLSRDYCGPIEYLKNIRDILSIKVKKNNYSNYTEYYDSESKEFVGELYKKDIEIFKYNFEGYSDKKILRAL